MFGGKLHRKGGKESKLEAQLNVILRSQSIQTGIICTYFFIIASVYIWMYIEDDSFPIDAKLKFLASYLDMKAIPITIMWQMRIPPKQALDYQTLEDYTLTKLAEARRLDIIQSCSQCIKETSEMAAGPGYASTDRVKKFDFDSVLLLKVQGAKSGVQFRFKSYAIRVFRHIREVNGVNTQMYSNSFRPDRDMKERFSEGKSGSFLYFTEDGKYIVKTITQEEKNSMLKILPFYYEHVLRHRNSNLALYVGLHAMKMYGATTYLVVMKNVMPNTRARKYDLKGSTAGRSVAHESTSVNSPQLNFVSRSLWSKGRDRMKAMQNTYKDAEFLLNEGKIRFPPSQLDPFLQALRYDVDFLVQMNVMDYSLLVGIPDFGPFRKSQYDGTNRLSIYSVTSIDIGTKEHPRIFAGIIDFLQEYNTRKKIEHFFKTRILRWDAKAISCVDPQAYGDRFLSFISTHVTEHA